MADRRGLVEPAECGQRVAEVVVRDVERRIECERLAVARDRLFQPASSLVLGAAVVVRDGRVARLQPAR